MKEYFAIAASLEDLNERVENYYQVLYDMGHTDKIQKSHYYYYGKGNTSSHIRRTGSQNQLSEVMINDYRSLCQHVVTLVTANRPSFDVKATNTDYASIAQCVLGEQILEYYMRDREVEKLLKRQCDYAVKYSEGFIGLDWDATAGQVIGIDENDKPYTDGDIRYSLYTPLQVIRDIYNEGQQDWVITVQKVNKYELAAKYPAYAEDILKVDSTNYKADQRDIDYYTRNGEIDNTDVVPFYTFYHRKCAALPEGRIVFFVETKKLLDGPLPYENIPISRMTPKDLDGTCLGTAPAWDLLGLQEVSDRIYSALVSNNLTFARQVVQTTPDNDINVSDLADGMLLIESDAEIKPVQLTRSAPESYQLAQAIDSKKQELIGVNEVVRGTPGPNLRSGNALAIVAAQAITYNSDLTAAYNLATEDVGTLTLRFLKTFAQHPRFASIVGKYKKAYLKEFKGEDLYGIDRVTVNQRNALMSTTAGKVQLAENLLQNGILTKPEQYLMVVETGSLDMLTEPAIVEQMLIKEENEKLAEGNNPPVTFIDSHQLHIREHKAVISNIESRYTPAVVKAVQDHIWEHINLLRSMDPEILMITGSQPSQFNQGAPQPPAPPQGQAPQGGAGIIQPPNPGEAPMKQPGLPSLPENTDATTQASYEQLQSMSNQGGV